MAREGEGNVDGVVREAAGRNAGEESEFDIIARHRGNAQEKMANMLVGHLHSHGNKADGEDSKGTAEKVDEQPHKKRDESGESVSEALHKSSDEARERVFQANDKTYDAIEEAKKSVQKQFEDAKHSQGNMHDDDCPNSYSAINEAKEMLKDKYGAGDELV